MYTYTLDSGTIVTVNAAWCHRCGRRTNAGNHAAGDPVCRGSQFPPGFARTRGSEASGYDSLGRAIIRPSTGPCHCCPWRR